MFTDPDKKPSLDPASIPNQPVQPANTPVKQGLWANLTWGNIMGAATTTVKVFTSTTADKQKFIDEAKSNINLQLEEKGDAPLFTQLLDLISTVASKKADNIDGVMGFIAWGADASTISKMFAAQAFSNLATKLNQERNNIANYDNQPTLTNLLSLLAKNCTQHLNRETLQRQTESYNKELKTVNELSVRHYPTSLEYLNKKIDLYVTTDDLAMRDQIENEIFEQLNPAEKKEFKEHLQALQKAKSELKETFNQVADDILVYIFPRRSEDPALKKFINSKDLFDTIWGQLQSFMSDAFLEQYISIEKNSDLTALRKEKLEAVLGKDEVANFIEAPSALLGGVTKYLLNFNTTPVDIINNALNASTQTNPQSESPSEAEKQQFLLDSFAYKNLSNWILDSVQAVTETKDKNLTGVLNYGSNFIVQLTESMIGKALIDLIPENEKIKKGEVLNVVSEKLEKKVSSFDEKTEFLPMASNFIQDLPLPKVLTDNLTLEIENYSKTEKEVKVELKKAERLHSDSKAKLEGYKGGALIFSLIENFSDVIVKQALNQNADLIEKTGLDEIIQDLLNELLPGLKIDDSLKQSFKDNLETFKNTNTLSEQSKNLFKLSIQTVLAQAIIGTLDESIKKEDNLKDQIFNKLQTAFTTRFTNLSEKSKKDMQKGLELQYQIDEKNELIEKLKENEIPALKAKLEAIKNEILVAKDDHKKLSKLEVKKQTLEKALKIALKPTETEKDIQKAFDDKLVAESRVKTALSEVKKLETNLDEVLIELNKRPQINDWTKETLKDLLNQNELVKEDETLAILSSKNLEVVSSALDAYSTLIRAQKELEKRKTEVAIKTSHFETFKNNGDFARLNAWIENKALINKENERLSEEISALEKEQSQYLPLFQDLTSDLATILGLSDKSKINLPAPLLDKIWPMVEDFKTNKISLTLFSQFAPVWSAVNEKEAYKKELTKNGENEAIVALVESATRRVMKEVPELISNKEALTGLFETLETFLPGSSKLENELTAELQSLVNSKDSLFANNQELLKNYIESTLFKFLSRIPGEQGSILGNITTFLNEAIAEGKKTSELKGFLDKDHMENLVDHLFKSKLHITSGNDLKSIPPPLRNVVYELMKKGAYEALLPVIMPTLENKPLKKGLDLLSGSSFLSNISGAVSEDLLNNLSSFVQNYDSKAKEMFQLLSGIEGNKEQIKALVKAIGDLKENGNLNAKGVAKAFSDLKFSDKKESELKELLKKNPGVIGGLQGILITPDKISSEIIKQLDATEEVKNLLTTELDQFLKTGQISYVAKAFAENMMLKFCVALAEKNTPKDGKDSLLIFTEKFLKITSQKMAELKDDKPFGDIAVEIEEAILKSDELGISYALKTLPEPLQKLVLNEIQGKIQDSLMDFYSSLHASKDVRKDKLDLMIDQVSLHAVKLGLAYAKPTLNETAPNGELKIVNTIWSGLDKSLEELAVNNFKIGEVLLNYPKMPIVKEFVTDQIKNVTNPEKLVAEREIASEITANIIAKPINQAVRKIIAFEETHKEKFDQNLMANILNAAASHLEIINKAEKDGVIKHADFVKAAGADLHKAVPKEILGTEGLEQHRKDNFYDPAAKDLLKLVFPNGKNDLTFVPENVRDQTWKLFKKKLVPSVLPIITESLLSQSSINNIILSALKSVEETLDEQANAPRNKTKVDDAKRMVPAGPGPIKPPPTPLGIATSRMMGQIIARMDLPSSIKNKVIDQDGQLSPDIQDLIVKSLEAQLNGSFIKTNLETTFNAIMNQSLEVPDKLSIDAEKAFQKEIMEPEIRAKARDVINKSISNAIDDWWATAQDKWDLHIENTFGKIGTGLKKGLDAVFRFVFFTVIGNILSFIFRPMFRAILHNWIISTDKNVDKLVDPFRRVPGDQSGIETHAIYNENLIYKLADAIRDSVKETLDAAR